MRPLAPLVMRLAVVLLVALVLADPGPGSGSSQIAQPQQRTKAPPRSTLPTPKKERRQRKGRRTTTTTTTTTTEMYDEEEDHTTPTTTTTVDPRTFDHSKYRLNRPTSWPVYRYQSVNRYQRFDTNSVSNKPTAVLSLECGLHHRSQQITTLLNSLHARFQGHSFSHIVPC